MGNYLTVQHRALPHLAHLTLWHLAHLARQLGLHYVLHTVRVLGLECLLGELLLHGLDLGLLLRLRLRLSLSLRLGLRLCLSLGLLDLRVVHIDVHCTTAAYVALLAAHNTDGVAWELDLSAWAHLPIAHLVV